MTSETSESRLEIVRDWKGDPIPVYEHFRIALHLDPRELTVDIEAPFYDDPAPSGPPGSTDGLWNHEVVELFLLGASDHYFEIEFGPYGHYLALELRGQRNLVHQHTDIDYSSNLSDRTWTGRARVPADLIPRPVGIGNAYAIHGTGRQRRYAALYPVPGAQPDFHRLINFGPIGI